MPSVKDFRIGKAGKVYHYIKHILGGKNTFVPIPPQPKTVVAADGNPDNVVPQHPVDEVIVTPDLAKLLENGDAWLLETGDFWILEDAVFADFLLEDGNKILLEDDGFLELQE